MFKTLTSLLILLTINEGYGMEFGITGVSMSRLPFYNPLKNFTCLDGSATIPFSYVNDDYCDCPDGTDEPGTSACPNGIFHCYNRGFVPKAIPSSFVNDGFCDCCDSSDEMNSTNCTDDCAQLALEAKRRTDEMFQRFTVGSRLRAHMVASAKTFLENKQLEVINLEILIDKAIAFKKEPKVDEKETEFDELEEDEAEEKEEKNTLNITKDHFEEIRTSHILFNSFDTDNNRLLYKDELKAIKIFDQNFDGDVTEEELSLNKGIAREPVKFESFHDNIWPRLKQLMSEKKTKTKQQETESLKGNNLLENDASEEKAKIEEHEKDKEKVMNGESEVKNIYTPEDFDEDTTKIVDAANNARTQLGTAENVLPDLENQLANLKRVLSNDYGEENEFALLNGQCFDYTKEGYSYKFCPFNQVTQSGQSGDSEIRLGIWAGWIGNNYEEMLYDRGQYCHKGPQRSTKVILTCALTNVVISVIEPNKCEYVLQFGTPASCRLGNKRRDVHEEL